MQWKEATSQIQVFLFTAISNVCCSTGREEGEEGRSRGKKINPLSQKANNLAEVSVNSPPNQGLDKEKQI